MNEVKTGKLPMIATLFILAIFQNYFVGAKIWWIFAQLYKIQLIFFVLGVSTVSRF